MIRWSYFRAEVTATAICIHHGSQIFEQQAKAVARPTFYVNVSLKVRPSAEIEMIIFDATSILFSKKIDGIHLIFNKEIFSVRERAALYSIVNPKK